MPRLAAMQTCQHETQKQLWQFVSIVTGLSILFYLFGPLIGSLAGVTNAELPGSALMFVVPVIAALLVAQWSGQTNQLWSTLRNIKASLWVWAVVVTVIPLSVFISSGGVATPGLAMGDVLILVLLFIIASLCEELGWTSFALPRLTPLVGELFAAGIIGAFCALWHVIPFIQNDYGVNFILGQCAFTFAFRFLLVRLTVVSRGFVWPAVIGHASYNVAWVLSPEEGGLYSPWVAAGLTALIWAVLYLGRSHFSSVKPSDSTVSDLHTS